MEVDDALAKAALVLELELGIYTDGKGALATRRVRTGQQTVAVVLPNQASHGSIGQASATKVRSNAPGGCQWSKRVQHGYQELHVVPKAPHSREMALQRKQLTSKCPGGLAERGNSAVHQPSARADQLRQAA